MPWLLVTAKFSPTLRAAQNQSNDSTSDSSDRWQLAISMAQTLSSAGLLGTATAGAPTKVENNRLYRALTITYRDGVSESWWVLDAPASILVLDTPFGATPPDPAKAC